MALIKPRGTTASKGSAASRFSYRARSAEEVKSRANRPVGARDSYLSAEVDFFTPPAGDNSVRILPPTWEDAKHYGLDIFVHYGIGPDKSAYLCLDKMKGEPCPICEERANAAAAGEEGLAKALRPRSGVLVWAINRKEEGKGPLAWRMAAGLDKDIVNCSFDAQSNEYLAIDDPSESGYDVNFKRIGTDERTEYSGITIARRPSPLADDPAVADRWLEFVANHPLPSLLQFRTYDEIKAAYAGTTVEEKPATEKPAASKLPVRRGAAAAPAPAQPPAAPPAARGAAQAPAVEAGEDLPSWEDVHALDETGLEALIEESQLDPSKENFENETQIQDWICAQLKIAAPAPAPAAAEAPKGSWKDRLNKLKK